MTTENEEALQIILDALQKYQTDYYAKLDNRDKKFMDKLDALQQRIVELSAAINQ